MNSPETRNSVWIELFKLPTEAMPVDLPEASFTAGTYVCSGDGLEITADGFSSTWSRIG